MAGRAAEHDQGRPWADRDARASRRRGRNDASRICTSRRVLGIRTTPCAKRGGQRAREHDAMTDSPIPKTRVLLADDQSLIRAGFRILLEAADDIEVVGEATDGAQAVDQARKQRADVVLMDIRMPNVD